MEKPNTVIVGHGTSIYDLKPEDIDSFDFVIRLKDCPAKVGKKTNAISSTSKHYYTLIIQNNTGHTVIVGAVDR